MRKGFFFTPHKRFFNKHFSRQIEETFLFISTLANKEDILCLRGKGKVRYFSFSFPLTYGDHPIEIPPPPSKDSITFIIEYSPISVEVDEMWAILYSSPTIQIRESKKRNVSPQPLRWGLLNEEKKELFRIARHALTHYVNNGDEKFILPQRSTRLHLRNDVDVAFWIEGQFRGSIIIENKEIGQAVATAAMMAARDPRFKPIGPSELETVVIEITLMGHLRIPLTQKEKQNSDIYTDKGYLLALGSHRGWFLPEIFNIRHFSGMPELLLNLAREKASIQGSIDKAETVSFEVEDLIEFPQRIGTIYSLKGPIVQENAENEIAVAQKIATWLSFNQDADGNFRVIVSARKDTSPTADWPRQAYAVWALAEFSKISIGRDYVKAAHRGMAAIEKQLDRRPREIAGADLTRAYLGKAAWALGERKLAEKFLASLLPLYWRDDVITLSHALGLARLIMPVAQWEQSGAPVLERRLVEKFDQDIEKREGIEFALYAELVNLFFPHNMEVVDRVTFWMKNSQNSDGSFPRTKNSVFSFTRGTGKIFEVLAVDSKNNKVVLARALDWLSKMQYDETNLFFVPKERQDKLVGGFRHDNNNPDAWVDSSAHILLGISRLLYKKHA